MRPPIMLNHVRFLILVGAASAIAVANTGAAPRPQSVETTDPAEMVATLRMLGGHAILRTPEVSDPDSVANRRSFETMVRKTFGTPAVQRTFAPIETPRPSTLVGRLESSDSIDNRGRSTYHVTLPLPDSRGYFQPSLSLQYTSGTGSGDLGPAFVIGTGFAASIVRGRSILARDGEIRGQELSERDRYYLDGKRLVCISGPGTHGRPGSVYRTEVDSFDTIYAEGSSEVIDRFVVRETNGRITTFGRWGETTDGYQSGYDEARGQLAPLAFTYALKRVEDPLGDYVEFNYVQAGRGEWLLDTILYAGGTKVAPPYTIKFRYSPALRPVSRFATGLRQDQSQRLDEIEVRANATSDVVGRYTFAFEAGPQGDQSRLRAVTGALASDVGEALQTLPSTTFQWRPQAPAGQPLQPFTFATGGVSIDGAGRFAWGDFNGDGKVDYVDAHADLTVFLSTTDGPSLTGNSWMTSSTVARITGSLPAKWVLPGDFNGDGREDLLVVAADGHGFIARATGENFQNLGAVDLASVWQNSVAADRAGEAGVVHELSVDRITVADFSGDARDDLLLHTPDGHLHLFFADGQGLTRSPLPAINVTADTAPLTSPPVTVTPFPADLNGDGLTDYGWLESDSVGWRLRYVLFLPEGNFAPPVTLATKTRADLGTNSRPAPSAPTVLTGDFNADGLTDFLVQDSTKWTTWLSRGPSTWSSAAPQETFKPVASFQLGPLPDPVSAAVLDLNDDGIDDLVWRTVAESAGPEVPKMSAVWRGSIAQGDGTFSAPQALSGLPWSSPDASPAAPVWRKLLRAHDFDGDGERDWVGMAEESVAGEIVTGYAPGRGCSDGLVRLGTVVEQFRDGYGRTLQVAFKAAKDDSIYTPGAPVAYPIRDFRSSALVVSDIWKDSGDGPASQFSYNYSGNHLDFSGRGGLGFAAFTTLDRQTGFLKYQFLCHSFPMTGLTQREQTLWLWRGAGPTSMKLVSSTDHAVGFDAVKDPATGRLFGTLHPFTTQIVEYRTPNDNQPDWRLEQGPPDPKHLLFAGRLPASAKLSNVSSDWFDEQDTAKSARQFLPIVGLPFAATASTPLAPRPSVDPREQSQGAKAFPARITFGNKRMSQSGFAGQQFSRTDRTFRVPRTPEDPLVNLLEVVTPWVGEPGQWKIQGTRVSYSYFANTTLLRADTKDSRTAIDDSPREARTTFHNRDAQGRLTSREQTVTQADAGAAGLRTTLIYSADEFDRELDQPGTEKTPDWSRTEIKYNRLFRKIREARYENGIRATLRYDPLGRNFAVINDAGYRHETLYAWTLAEGTRWTSPQQVVGPNGESGLESRSVYAVRESETQKPTTTIYYDRLARAIRVVAEDTTADVAVVDTVYNALGQQVAQSLPYAPGAEEINWTVKAYDGFGFVSAETKVTAANAGPPPRSAAEFLNRGRKKEADENLPGAIADYTQAATLDPAGSRPLFLRAQARERKEDFAGAVEDYSQALARSPDSAPILAQRGDCYRKQGNYIAGLADLDAALKLEPRHADYWAGRGQIALDANQVSEALGNFDRAIELDSENYFHWYDRGRAKMRRRDFTAAIADFDHALELNPKSELAHYRRAWARRELHDYAGAIADYTTTIELSPQDYTNYRGRGIAHDLAGDFRAALADFQKACQLADEPVPYLQLRMNLIQRRLGQREEPTLSSLLKSDTKEWVREIMRFLAGETTEEEFLAASQSVKDGKAVEQQCEAYYFAGMQRLLAKDLPGARDRFQRCLATEQVTFYEYESAQAELRRLPVLP